MSHTGQLTDRAAFDLVRLRRFERPTTAFGGQYSIQLSYRRFKALRLHGGILAEGSLLAARPMLRAEA